MSQLAVVTGAGGGVGGAVSCALLRSGWDVALVDRRRQALVRIKQRAGKPPGQILLAECDVGDPAAVARLSRRVLRAFGRVDVLVNAAGTNVPRRSLEVLSDADYRSVIRTNLHGPYLMVQAFIPQMRSQGSGTIINIVSDAGKQASPKAGPSYVMSKFGLAGLTQAINAEERGRGIRACAVFPGDINTALLDRRPDPPLAGTRQLMLQPEDVAECVLLAIRLPARAVVEEILIRPR